MKGLLLKDWYMVKKHCRAYLFISLVFLVFSHLDRENLFFVFYPCMLCGIIPVSLLAYDERSRWQQYCGTLPYTRGQLVSVKYLMGLLLHLAILLVICLSHGVMLRYRGESLSTLAVLAQLIIIVFTVSTTACLPFVFRLGVEKGRIAYYVMVGIVCAASVIASRLLGGDLQIQPTLPLGAVCLASIVIYALGWYLSVRFYQKREF